MRPSLSVPRHFFLWENSRGNSREAKQMLCGLFMLNGRAAVFAHARVIYIASTQNSTRTQKSEHRTIRKCQHKTANGHEAINSPRQVSGLIPVPTPLDLLYLPDLSLIFLLFRQHQPTVLPYTLIQPASVSTDTAGNDNIFPAPYTNATL